MMSPPLASEVVEVQVKGARVPANVHAGKRSGRAPALLIVNPFSSNAHEHSQLMEDLLDRLHHHAITAITVELRCERMILDDYHAYTLEDAVLDVQAALTAVLAHRSVDPVRFTLIGVEAGAIICAVVLDQLNAPAGVCLLNPLTGEALREAAAHMRKDAADAEGSANLPPQSFVESALKINAPHLLAQHERPALIVDGAARVRSAGEPRREYVEALRDAGRAFEHLLIPFGDFGFTDPAARDAAIEAIDTFVQHVHLPKPDRHAPVSSG